MNAFTIFKAWWTTLAAREQRLLGLAAALVGLALVWWLLLAAPLALLKTADTRRQQLDAQLQQMQAMAAQAASLQAQTRLAPQEAGRLLQSSVQQVLGSGAQIVVAGERATLSLKGVSADLLAQWLALARQNAQALPAEVRVSRSAGAGTGAGAATPVWDGTVVLNLPGR